MRSKFGFRLAAVLLFLAIATTGCKYEIANGKTNTRESSQLIFKIGDIQGSLKPVVYGPIRPVELPEKPKPKPVSPNINTLTTEGKSPALEFKSGFYQCVVYIRKITGDIRVAGRAMTIKPETQVPEVGAVVLTKESLPGTNSGHVALVKGIVDGNLILEEANYTSSKIGNVTVGRELPIDSPLIRGYLIPNEEVFESQ